MLNCLKNVSSRGTPQNVSICLQILARIAVWSQTLKLWWDSSMFNSITLVNLVCKNYRFRVIELNVNGTHKSCRVPVQTIIRFRHDEQMDKFLRVHLLETFFSQLNTNRNLKTRIFSRNKNGFCHRRNFWWCTTISKVVNCNICTRYSYYIDCHYCSPNCQGSFLS